MMRRLAHWSVRWWWAIVAAWLALAGVLFAIAPPFEQVATYDETAFLGEDAGAIKGGFLLADGWPDDDFSRTIAVVVESTDGPLDEADERWIADLAAWVEGPHAPEALDMAMTYVDDERARDFLLSADGEATFVVIGMAVPPFTPPANEGVAELRAHIASTDVPAGTDVYVTGTGGVAADESQAIDDGVNRTHAITLLLVVLILLWVYRSPVAPLVPLLTIGVAFVVSLSTVSLLAQAGMQVASLYEQFSIVIVFGAGTDYCLFVVSRYHEELKLGEERGYRPNRALRRRTTVATMLVLGGVIGSSAGTTIAGFLSMSVAEFGLFRNMGPAMAVAVAITLAAALTFTPALLRVFGRNLFWPHLPIKGDHGATEPLVELRADELDLPHDPLELLEGHQSRGDDDPAAEDEPEAVRA